MLGRTNITTVKGGTIVSDIADYEWNDAATLNINSSFKKAFYANNMLIAITKSGTILYTRDGENWEEADLDIDVEYNISDGIWDGHRFVFVGSHSTNNDTLCQALIVTTQDFQEYEIIRDLTGSEYEDSSAPVNELSKFCCGIFHSVLLNEDATYTVIYSALSRNNITIGFAKGTLNKLYLTDPFFGVGYDKSSNYRVLLESIYIEIAKKSDCFIFYAKAKSINSYNSKILFKHLLGISNNGNTYSTLEKYYEEDHIISENMFSIFECKDSLYYRTLTEETNKLVRIDGISEGVRNVVSADEHWKFVDAVYFNKSEIFINNHQMLVVKEGENITGKVAEDLIDISYDFSLINIVKAFEKIYIFGTNGNILVSCDEIKNQDALAVKTMTAAKALYEAKEYTNMKYAELEERVAALEAMNDSSTEV